MKLVPKAVTRLAGRTWLQASKKSPTLMVVGGVVGLGVTAVLASKASRQLDPITSEHVRARIDVRRQGFLPAQERRALVGVYFDTSIKLTRLYGPTLVVGTLSAASVLAGHKILMRRHVATMAAYTGLLQEFTAYRGRVADSFGEDREREIYDGAKLVYKEDPDHKGEYKLEAEYDETSKSYLRPWFDHTNPSYTVSSLTNRQFLTGVQAHMNRLLDIRGYVFLFEALDALGIERSKNSIVTGWLSEAHGGKDCYIDFGFMTGTDPHTVAFRNGEVKSVQLNFNCDGLIWDKL